MKLSNFFLPLLKEDPSDAHIISHKLMLRSGMIKQTVSGIYTWLPLGLLVLQNISKIVRDTMNKHGLIEILMPCIQSSDLWIESSRYDSYGKEMLRINDRHNNSLLFGPTAEELVTDIFRSNIKSYKSLPITLYQIQWKFRDEIRPRFGVLRAREFLMKDGYSFDIDKTQATKTYFNIYNAYIETFKNMSINVVPVVADNGPIGGDLSHEFHIPSQNGESTIYYDSRFHDNDINFDTAKKLYAAASEKHSRESYHSFLIRNKESAEELELLSTKSIEIGHIFYFGNKYSKSMNTFISDYDGKQVAPEMCSYGIGISRLTAAIIEANHDDKGIIWPKSISPFYISIINLHINDSQTMEYCQNLYSAIQEYGLSVIYDDSDDRAGIKFARHELIGSTWHIIVNKNKLLENIIELKNRNTNSSELISSNIDSLLNNVLK